MLNQPLSRNISILDILPTIIFLLFISMNILLSAIYSYFTYDIAKVISYLYEADSLIGYIKTLKFSLGISVQTYFLSQFFILDITFLKLGSYIFLLATFIVCLTRFVSPKDYITSVLMAISVSIFFQSKMIQYLGSYGMLVYCQGFFLGYFLLRFSEEYERILFEKGFTHYLPYLIIFFLSALIDVRFSFYIFITYLFIFIRHIKTPPQLIKIINYGLLAGVSVGVPIMMLFSLLPNLIGFRPAHIDSFLFSHEANFGNVASFLNNNIQSYFETIASNQPALKWGFVTLFLIGTIDRIRNTEKSNFPIYLIAVSLLIQITASLFELYPFGSIRYSTFLLPIFILLYLEGVYLLISQAKKLGRTSFFGLSAVLIIAASFDQIGHITTKYERIINAYDRENLTIQRLHNVAENDDIHCDIVTEKVVTAYGHSCSLVSTWNLTRNLGEADGFYSKFEQALENKTELHFMLYKTISIKHFASMREILKNNSYELIKELHSTYHFYSYRKLAPDDSKNVL